MMLHAAQKAIQNTQSILAVYFFTIPFQTFDKCLNDQVLTSWLHLLMTQKENNDCQVFKILTKYKIQIQKNTNYKNKSSLIKTHAI